MTALFPGAQDVDKFRLCLIPTVFNCSRIPVLLPNVDNLQNQQKIAAFRVDFVFHRTVDMLLIIIPKYVTRRSVDKYVENFAHVVHNLLSH